MVFTQNRNADQSDPLSYGNLRGLDTDRQLASFMEINSREIPSNSLVTDVGKENMFSNLEELKIASTALKDGSPISPENFSFSWFPGSSCHSSTLDHGKRPLSDVKPFQVDCKRPKQTDESTWLYAYGEHPFSTALEPSFSALAEEFVDLGERDHICANNGTSACSTSSGIPYPNHEEPIGEESLHLPDWVTSFPGYFEDFGPAVVYNQEDDIDSPIHEYLPSKAVAVGPDHQADIPEWRPRANMSDSILGSAPRDEDSESDKWIKHCVIPMPSSYPVPWVGDYRTDCGCSDDGSIRCVRQHVMESREKLNQSMGEHKFRELGLCEMGEAIAQRWTDEEERVFLQVVLSNPVSSGTNFWDLLPLALPGKMSMELVSYYFNVFMLRKRAQQNRSDLLHVDSDDDELPGEPVVAKVDDDSAVESPRHGYHIGNSVSTEDADEESEGEHSDSSLRN